jgi:Icc-related predicted phosphoesterase
MLILVTGDFHGQFGWVPEALDRLRPDLFLCVGDWGDPGETAQAEYEEVIRRVPTLSVFGNHDDRELLGQLRNRDGTTVLLGQGESRPAAGLTVMGISGIWAKTRLGSRLTARWEAAQRREPGISFEEWTADVPLPPYVTDDEVAQLASAASGRGVDVLITHGCPIGLADTTPAGGRGGQRCFRQAFQTVAPRIHLCGHLHRFQRADLPDGRAVLNSGDGASREGWLIRWERDGWEAEPLGLER